MFMSHYATEVCKCPNYNKILGKIQSAVYDSMLKANKISSGTKNYIQVIDLIIAVEYYK